ncbi:hypothetical protein C7212DRAFT_343089 [Tuber magnatum]|uniref:Uncharacterized protein n=1 Tax=Tuber magnatum TaxID=42249 RepID=A0A317SS90_9PEZI|nr:hypothetical protein C7212DRAFT_343089 [Tuber magnatum]
MAQNPNLQYVHRNVVGVLQINNLSAIGTDGDQGENQGDQVKIQDGNQGGDHGENLGDQDGNQGGNWGANDGAAKGQPQVGHQDENQGGSQGADQGTNQGAAKGEPQVGNQDENQGGNQGENQGGDHGTNQGTPKKYGLDLTTRMPTRHLNCLVQAQPSCASGGENSATPHSGQRYASPYRRWPYITGSRFTELEYFEFRRLCRALYEVIALVDMGCIIGVTGKGQKQICRAPYQPISDVYYIFIQSDIDIRTWLLANPIADDLLDLLVYGECNPEGMMPQCPARQWYSYRTEEEYTHNMVILGEGRGRIHCRYPPSHRVAGRHTRNAASQVNQVTGKGAHVAGEGSQEAEVITSQSDLEAPLSGPPTLLPPSPDNYRQQKCSTMSGDQAAVESDPKRARIEPSDEVSQTLPIEVTNFQNAANEGNQETGDLAALAEPNTPNIPIPIHMYRPRKVKLLPQSPVPLIMS